ncbi:hypothetical protein ZHAS_00014675 [Anopheles sinensis]|uniref:Uncharacterized protein n=1 Tax=Anopheles sinensis TaxID=74873 RepID=A0A084W8T4_ANOSI|nr:hypothetical protein ZHAS_00014675 [Anopheles sinensis]
MFRKSKQISTPLPKPPTEAQMIEDLQLFFESRPTPAAVSTENIAELSSESSTEDWWKVFEASLENHQQFRGMKIGIEELKSMLQETRSELQASCKEIQDQIDRDLRKLRQTMKED